MQLHLDTNKKELKSHGTYEFPVNVNFEQLSRYERKSFLWHWHKEIELTIILQGEMNYQVNNSVYHLKEGDGLFCNSNALHTGFSYSDSDCIYISTTFHPRFLYGYENSILQTKYTDCITGNSALSACPLFPAVLWQKAILDELAGIWELSRNPSPAYEMQVHLSLSKIWLLLWQNCAFGNEPSGMVAQKNMDRLKIMLSYIQNHYTEKITLSDIAKEVNICQSECCRFFKKHMKESLFDYLLSFRIEKSLPYLREGRLSITEIASLVGFPSSSYYTKVFRERMGCTPSQYQGH
ncbi:MAG: AraC family transcriptional regulator [Clostridiales bacterium]|nr:AraC family transcriptional regulator [Clostridiales bacterium]